MATEQELIAALRRADQAGDVEAAKAIARRIAQQRASPNADQIAVGSIGKQEYERKLAKEIQWMRDNYGPTGSFGENLAAGAGKSIYDTGRGIGQLAGTVSEGEVAEARRLDAPLAQSGGGLIGGIAGYGAQMYLPGTSAAMLGKGAQGANLMRAASGARESAALNTVANVSNAVRAATLPTTMTGNAVQGGLLGYVQPVVSGESRGANATIGAMAGAGGYMVPGAIKGTKAMFIDPLTEAGNNRIVARMLKESAQNPDNLLNPSTVDLPGYNPTLAEATLDPGVAQMQRSLQAGNSGTANAIYDAYAKNNAARVKALRSLAPSVKETTAARAASTKDLYAAARQGVAVADDEFKAIMQRPSIKEGLRKARKLAAESGEQLPKDAQEFSGGHLQYVDQALSDMIGKAKKSGQNGYVQKLIATRDELRGWMERQIPEYNQAQQAYREASIPVDQAKIAKQIYEQSLSNRSMPKTGDPLIAANASKGAIIKLEKTAKAAGVKGDPREILTADQQAALSKVKETLDRFDFAENAGRATGSNTAQNMAGINALQQMGLPKWAMNLGPVNRLATIVDKAASVAGVPERLQGKLAEIIVNPQEAQRVLMSLPEHSRSKLVRAMQYLIDQQKSAQLAIASERQQTN